MTDVPFISIFAIGDVLDPRVRIEGKCRECRGTGRRRDPLRFEADCCVCQGTGAASALVRLSELLTPLHGAEYLGTAEEVGIEP